MAILKAKQNGVEFGRKRSVNRKKIKELRQQGVGPSEIARQMNIGRSTVYKIMTEIEACPQQAEKGLSVVA